VLARLEVRGLLLGEEPEGSSVLDFGTGKMYRVPREVAERLPALPVQETEVAPDAVVPGDPAAFSRELYAVFSYIMRRRPRLLVESGDFSKRDLKALAAEYPRPVDEGSPGRTRLAFQTALLEDLGLVRYDDRYLVADVARAEAQLAEPPAARAAGWLAAYRGSHGWLELERLPGVQWSPAYGKGRSFGRVASARAAVIDAIARVSAGGGWVPTAELSSALALANPDFLMGTTPNARYYASGRYASSGNDQQWTFYPIGSFEDGWAKVDGAFIGLVVEALAWMGLLDTASGPAGPAVRPSAMGRHLLAGGPAPETPQGGRVVLQPNFHLVAFGPVPEADLLALERFADRVSSDAALELALTRESVYRAQREGLDDRAVRSTLERLTGAPLPQNVERTLSEWQSFHERIVVRRHARLLQAGPEVLTEIVAADGGAGLRTLSETVALVVDDAAALRALDAAGYGTVAADDRRARGSVDMADDGSVAFRRQVPSLHAAGRLERLAERDEATGGWRLTQASAARARSRHRLGAEAQLGEWAELLGGRAPEWLERRIKAWSAHYGTARLHDGLLLELRDEEALRALEGLAGAPLPRFEPKGVLVSVDRDELARLRERLAELGIALRG
jgi:hypothetical protein